MKHRGHSKKGDSPTNDSEEDLSSWTGTEGGGAAPGGKEYVFKVVVVGDYNVGKTTFIRRLLSTSIDDDDDDEDADLKTDHNLVVMPTIGVEFFSRLVEDVVPGVNVRLQLWDTAGLERYAAMHASTFRNASLVIVLYDVTEKQTLRSAVDTHLVTAAEYIPDLDQQNIFIVGNKIDLLEEFYAGKRKPNVEKLKRALKRNQKAREHPEAAFAQDDEETDDVSSYVKPSRQEGAAAPPSGVTTQEDLKCIFADLFPDVNYGEVSAKYKKNMADVLLRVCVSLLIEEGAVGEDQVTREDLIAMSKDAQAQSFLPGGKDLKNGSLLSASVHTEKFTSLPGTPSPSMLNRKTVNTTKKEETPAKKGSPTTPFTPAVNGSWRNTKLNSAFSFDQPPSLAGASFPGIFSPQENDTKVFSSRQSSEGPPEVDFTDMSRPESKLHSKTNDSRVSRGVNSNKKANTDASPIINNNNNNNAATSPNSATTKKEREKAEMDALLNRAKNRGSNPKNNTTTTTTTTPAPDSVVSQSVLVDLDAAEDSRRGGTSAKPFRSILDDEHEKRQKELARLEPAEDSDEDGLRLQDHIQSTFAKIEHNAALDKQAGVKEEYLLNKYKPAKKKDKKASKVKLTEDGSKKKESKCKC